MRVLVYGMVGSNRGGIETFLLKMNQNMSENTVFDYVIEEKTCLHTVDIQSRGGLVYYISSRRKKPVRNLIDNKKLLKSLRKDIDAVYFNLSSLSWIYPIKMAVDLGYRVYVHSHNSQFIEKNSDFVHQFLNRRNKKKLSKYNIRRLSCSRPATDFLFNSGDNVEMIHNAIESDKFSYNAGVRHKMREELNLQDTKIIGFVGRLGDQKNPLFLPEILKSVLNNTDGVKMLIFGDGPMKAELEHKIVALGLADDCRLMGNVTNINEYMQAMDTLVLPSLHEGLPYVIVEGQTTGLRCFVSDTVTEEVNVTGNVTFLPLLETADNWGKEIARYLNSEIGDRERWSLFMNSTNFNIDIEAKRLEAILQGNE